MPLHLRYLTVKALCATLLTLAGLQFGNSISAQTPIVRQQPLPTGVDPKSINALFQDKIGNLWIGTKSGLVLYNGSELRLYTTRDSLCDNDITALSADSGGVLWVGHRSGKISRYMAGRFSKFITAEGTANKAISAIAFDSDAQLWFATQDEGVYYLHENRLHNLSAPNAEADLENTEGLEGDAPQPGDLVSNAIYALQPLEGGKMMLASDAGLMLLTPNPDKKKGQEQAYIVNSITMKNGLPDNIVKGIYYPGGDELWVAMQDSGICAYNLQAQKFRKIPGWAFGTINQMAHTPTHQVWLATKTGAVNFNPAKKTFSRVGIRQGLPSNDVNCVLEDREGTLWAASEKGLTHILGDRFSFMTRRDGLPAQNVYAILVDKQETLWAGTDSGLTRFTRTPAGDYLPKQYLTNAPNPKKGSRYVAALAEDARGYIWIATSGYWMYRLNPRTDEIKHYGSALQENENLKAVVSVSVDTKGDIWFSTFGGGVLRASYSGAGDAVSFKNFTKRDGLAGDYVYQVHTDKKGRVWVGTDGTGVSLFQNGSFTTYAVKEGLTTPTAISILEDPAGGIWVLTAGEGVFKFTGTGFTRVRTFPPEFGTSPLAITLDAKVRLIAIASGRIGVFNVTDSSQAPKYYTEENGLLNFEPHQNVAFADNKGIIWIGTSHGLVRYNPLSESPGETAPQVVITRLSVLGDERPLEDNISLGASENNLTFDFIAVNLATPKNVVYQYRLTPEDPWSQPTTSRFISLPNQIFGEYALQIRASINGVDWSENPTTFRFEIQAPIWRRWYVLLGGAILIALGVYGYIQYSTQRVRRENLVLEGKVKERTAEISAKNEQLEQANEEITSKNDQLFDAYKEIEEKNHNITESIVYAQRIQQTILPDDERIRLAFNDVAVLYIPKDIVSGDFYWYEHLNGKDYIAAIDCTGHGVPGAFMSVMAYNLLNQTVLSHPDATPDVILKQLDELVQRALKQEREDSVTKDGMDVALIAYDKPNKQLHYAGALRPLFHLRNGEISEIKGDRYPIGGGQHDNKTFALHTIAVQPGDLFFTFSDGLVDQFGSETGRKYTPKRLRNLLLNCATIYPTLAEVREAVRNDWQAWRGTSAQIDDVVLIGLKPLAA